MLTNKVFALILMASINGGVEVPVVMGTYKDWAACEADNQKMVEDKVFVKRGSCEDISGLIGKTFLTPVILQRVNEKGA